MPEFVPKRTGHKPFGNYDATPFGGFLAGVAIAVGVIVAVRLGPRLLTRVFLRRVGAFVTKSLIQSVIQNLITGPIPGTLLGPNPSRLRQVIAFANVAGWTTGLWFYLSDPVIDLKGIAEDRVIDAGIDFGLSHGIIYEIQKQSIQVIDNGNPFVMVINGGGTAFYGVAPAWRVDP